MKNLKNKYTTVNGSELRIAISGQSGCGNTTVSALLAKTLGVPCINYTFKNLAAELKMSFEEIIERAKTDFSFDKIVDTKQTELAQKGSCVLGSRLAIWLLTNADIKVYLYASSEQRALRIQKREGGSIEEIKSFTAERDSEDTRRYKELYNIDNTVYNFADLIIDTENIMPDKIVNIIIEHLTDKGLIILPAPKT